MERVFVDSDELLKDHIEKIMDQCVWINNFANKNYNNVQKMKCLLFDKKTGVIFKEDNTINWDRDVVYGDTTEELFEEYCLTIEDTLYEAYIACKESGIFEHHRLMRQRVQSHGWGLDRYLELTRPHLYM